MSSRSMSLAEIQREMASSVMMPLTPDEGMRERASDGRDMRKVAESLIAPSDRLSAFERLEIYNRQYWFRVLGSLMEDFPALRALIGAGRFESLSTAYLQAHPSRSFTLRNLGSRLPEWLEAHAEYTGRRHRLAVDVARIEWAFVEAFDNADYPALTNEQIAMLDASSPLGIQPHVRLLALRYPADDLVIALHSGEKRQTSEAGVQFESVENATIRVSGVQARPTWLAAHRLENSVYYRRLAREEFEILQLLRAGESLAGAIDKGFAQSRMSVGRRGQAVQRWFAAWAELGWITSDSNLKSSSVR